MRKLMRYFLSISSIDKMDLCIVGIKMNFHLYLIFYLGHFNILKSVLCTEQLAFGQQIRFNKNEII